MTRSRMPSKTGGNNMEFLKELGLEEGLIEKLQKRYENSILDLFILEKANVEDNIRYMKKIGIKRIEEILLMHIEIFTKNQEEVENAFLKHNIKEIVEEINEDPMAIELV